MSNTIKTDIPYNREGYAKWLTDICREFKISGLRLSKITGIPQKTISRIMNGEFNMERMEACGRIDVINKIILDIIEEHYEINGGSTPASIEHECEAIEDSEDYKRADNAKRAALEMSKAFSVKGFSADPIILMSAARELTDDAFCLIAMYHLASGAARDFLYDNVQRLSVFTDDDVAITEAFQKMSDANRELVMRQLEPQSIIFREIKEDTSPIRKARVCFDMVKRVRAKTIDNTAPSKAEWPTKNEIKKCAASEKKNISLAMCPVYIDFSDDDDEDVLQAWRMPLEENGGFSRNYVYMFDSNGASADEREFIKRLLCINDEEKWKRLAENFDRFLSFGCEEWMFLGMFNLTYLCELKDGTTGMKTGAIRHFIEGRR